MSDEPVRFSLGMSNAELARRLGISQAQMVAEINAYLREFPEVAAYIERWRREHPAEAAADDALRDSGARSETDPKGER